MTPYLAASACHAQHEPLCALRRYTTEPSPRKKDADRAPPMTSSPTSSSTPTPTPPRPRFENIWNAPNILTLSRMALCPVIGWAIATHQPWTAVTLLGIAGTTDLLDGWLARRFHSKTMFGSIADPAADKLLMATMVISLGVGGHMSWPLAAIILGRDVFLVGLAFYLRYQSLPRPRSWSRYFNPRLPSVQVMPTRLSKYNTFLQLVLVGVLTVFPLLPETWQTHPHTTRTVTALEYIVAATTIWTGLDYAMSRRAVRYLHKPQ